jgi:DNA-binding NarL/FixJ family response regulator
VAKTSDIQALRDRLAPREDAAVALLRAVEEAPRHGPAEPTAPHERPRVLVVEDELIVAADLAARLVRMSYDVVGTATTAESAIAQAAERRPDVILMDIVLRGPDDGITAAQVIHEDLDIPVVFVTSHSDEATLERARAADPHGYVLKPFHDEALRVTLELALSRHSAARARARAAELESIMLLARAAAHEINNPLTVVVASIQLLARRYADDPEITARMERALEAASRIREIVLRLGAISQVERSVATSGNLPPMLDIFLSGGLPPGRGKTGEGGPPENGFSGV